MVAIEVYRVTLADPIAGRVIYQQTAMTPNPNDSATAPADKIIGLTPTACQSSPSAAELDGAAPSRLNVPDTPTRVPVLPDAGPDGAAVSLDGAFCVCVCVGVCVCPATSGATGLIELGD